MCSTSDFIPQDLIDIADALELDWPDKIKRKLLALKMLVEMIPQDTIAKVLNVTTRTIRNYRDEFIEGGIASTLEDRAYRPISSVEPHFQCLRCFFMARPVASAKEGADCIAKLTGIKFSEDQARRIMKKIGLKFRKSGQIPGKADPQLQFDFLQNKLLPKLEEARLGKRKVFFVDAAHFVMGAFLGMLWCVTRVFTRTASGRKRYNVLGAVDSQTRELITVTNDSYINAKCVCELMWDIRALHQDTEITLVLDNAKYQKCQVVFTMASVLGIELLYLPGYSPNLNIIERLWKYVKKSCLYNKYYPEFGQFKNAIDQCLLRANRDEDCKEHLKSLLTLNFQLYA